jgi:hypothetical protein
MRSVLVNLTSLDYEDTQNIFLEKLKGQEDPEQFNWDKLTTLCWAIGAIGDTQRTANLLLYSSLS